MGLGPLGEGYVGLKCDAWYTGSDCPGVGSDPRVANLRLGMGEAGDMVKVVGVEESVMASDSYLLRSDPEKLPSC